MRPDFEKQPAAFGAVFGSLFCLCREADVDEAESLRDRFFEQEKAAREGAFPAAALAGEPEAFAFSNGERYIVNRFVAASVMFCQIADKRTVSAEWVITHLLFPPAPLPLFQARLSASAEDFSAAGRLRINVLYIHVPVV